MNSQQLRLLVSLVVVGLLAMATCAHAATVEFLSGSKVECTVVSKTETVLTVEILVSGKKITSNYQLATIHAVTIGDKRYVLNEKTAGTSSTPKPATGASRPATGSTGSSNTGGSGAGNALGSKDTRTRAEVEAMIDQLGRTPPDWYNSTPLNFPQTLELNWPEKPGGAWNNQKNMGQYIWDVINTNPGKWREGVRLMHHLLVVNKDDPQVTGRVTQSLGTMYHNLLEDYARSAFWLRKAGVEQYPNVAPGKTMMLAECYWRLGSKSMADELLDKAPATVSTIKLLADMGDTAKALQLCDALARQGYPDTAYMHAGDASRIAGQYQQALQYFQKVLDVPATGQQQKRIEKIQARARASMDAIKLFELTDVSRVRDGTYQASSLGYEAQVQVDVTVRSGRIESVRVSQHREKQFYSALTDTPAKIIAKQGVKGVDATTSATLTSEAIINATAKALASGAK
jgi:uncharacterized protein with FMN-binding domain